MPKTIIYQLLPRLFGNRNRTNCINGTKADNGCGRLNDITSQALAAIKDLGVTHVWYTGVIEHATATNYSDYGIAPDPPHIVKGKAGSPYAIKDYYDICPDLAENIPLRITEFEELVERTRQAGLKTLIDLVPNHVARHYVSDARPDGVFDFGHHDNPNQAFAIYNNFYYLPQQPFVAPIPPANGDPQWQEYPAKMTGNDCISASPTLNDWYETVKLNYGVNLFDGRSAHFDPIPDTWHKMLHIMQYWAGKGIDGFRCDMVEMVPVSFWHWAITAIKKEFPDFLFVAEVYNPALYHDYIHTGGFDLLYDKVGMYDTLRNVITGFRPVSDISNAIEAIAPHRGHMLFFTENHDEQRIASSFFADNPRRGWPATFVSATLLPNAFMLYSGQELGEKGMDSEGFSGQDGRTTIFDYWCVDTLERWMNDGQFDGGRLTPKEQQLREQHRHLLQLVQQHEAFVSGEVYHLTWCNTTFRVFPWVRYTQDEVFLLLANFTNAKLQMTLNVPGDMFEKCGLKPHGFYHAEDLMGSGKQISFFADVALIKGFEVKMKPYGCMIFRLK
ncbi:alpha-amylase family protein [Breznakibacter xylanolyticus]|nr:alpha-amylase family protein [Breznakibacter xylanolyticus]